MAAASCHDGGLAVTGQIRILTTAITTAYDSAYRSADCACVPEQ